MAGNIPPELNYMPWHIKNCIVANTDFLTKCHLQKASKEMRQIALNSPHEFIEIKIHAAQHEQTVITATDAYGYYEMNYDGMDDCVSKAASDFCLMIKHPNTKVESFVYKKGTLAEIREAYYPDEEADEEWEREILRARTELLAAIIHGLSQFNHQLNFSEVELGDLLDEGTILSWLPFFKPITLEVINIHVAERATLRRVKDLDQWKFARMLTVQNARNILGVDMDMGDAYFLTITGSTLSVRDIYITIRRMLDGPDHHFRALRIQSATYNRRDFAFAVNRFNLIHALNGVFIEMPNGFLRIIQEVDMDIVLVVYTLDDMEGWPIMQQVEENGDNGLENNGEEAG